eukprot:TRINITY_DN2113_c0_g1_i1.p1 TRINITY_DN2113_c0_g1~~TRINITY_DN2113_c0_g1_i1.p1  ORF type:complete len:976 (+),score=169.35 TRINITY_DN2113_c0_g1_i1:58-2985(+)
MRETKGRQTPSLMRNRNTKGPMGSTALSLTPSSSSSLVSTIPTQRMGSTTTSSSITSIITSSATTSTIPTQRMGSTTTSSSITSIITSSATTSTIPTQRMGSTTATTTATTTTTLYHEHNSSGDVHHGSIVAVPLSTTQKPMQTSRSFSSLASASDPSLSPTSPISSITSTRTSSQQRNQTAANRLASHGDHEDRLSFLRSEQMQCVQLLLQNDAAHDIIEELISLGVVQFVDLNEKVTLFQRKFVKEVRRWDEAERKIRHFEEELRKHKQQFPQEFNLEIPHCSPETVHTKREWLDDMEGTMESIEKELKICQSNEVSLLSSICRVKEALYLLEKDKIFFDQHGFENDVGSSSITSEELHKSLDRERQALLSSSIPELENVYSNLKVISGVISRDHVDNLCRLLWRATRGNIFLRSSDITDLIFDKLQEPSVRKTAFIAFVQGTVLQTKVINICTSLQASMYECPLNSQERSLMREGLLSQLHELEMVLRQTTERRRMILVNNLSLFSKWKVVVYKEKLIYQVMNMTSSEIAKRYLVAEAWCPTSAIPSIMFALRHGTARSGTNMPSLMNPIHSLSKTPTFYRLNDLTKPFQAIVDAYGVASFGEINPAPFSIITFPFIFALMFGDVGHGLLLLLYSMYLIYKSEGSTANQKPHPLALIRYMLLLMAVFSIYVGIIYGEFFSLPFQLFPAMWSESRDGSFKRVSDYTYPFGIDPIWLSSSNTLEFFNSIKMKLSVIFGVSQMVMGLGLSYVNHIQFGRKLAVYVEFIPQMIFMLATFGYMNFLILLKWAIDWTGREAEAPSLINTMIDMFLQPGVVNIPLYPGQATIQLFLLLTALLCIPIMLFGSPFLKQRMAHTMRAIPKDDEKDEHKEFPVHNFWDDMTHQTIHTIEFVLGAVSNTASYLRIWALSLAHSELSKVFWEQIMGRCLQSTNIALILFGFCVWLFATIAVLMIMESLSAFLHALRLHWYEGHRV